MFSIGSVSGDGTRYSFLAAPSVEVGVSEYCRSLSSTLEVSTVIERAIVVMVKDI